MSPVKEPRYWSEGQAEGLTPFRTRDAYARLFDGVTSERAVGEASPQYLNSATAAENIAADIPAAKLIVSLRNPAERAYSSYLGRLRGARERCGLEAAMRPGTYYFETSLYHPRLTRYFDRFDRSRIKVIIFEDFVANTGMVLREIHEFLEIDTTFVTDVVERHNPAMVPRSITQTRFSSRRRSWSVASFLARCRGQVSGLAPSNSSSSDPRSDCRDQSASDCSSSSVRTSTGPAHWSAATYRIGWFPDRRPFICTYSHARAACQSRSTVATEMSST